MASVVRPVDINRGVLVSTSAADEDPAWLVGTNYAATALVNRDTLAGKGRRWKSAQAGNMGHDPATDDGTWWVDAGPSFTFRMFSDSATRQTTHADSLAVALQMPAGERVDTVWMDNLLGTAARIVQTDPIDGVLVDQTFSLISDSGITDWYMWFFEPIERMRDLLVIGLKPYSGSLLNVTISEAGATVGCGALVTGFSKTLGSTRWGLNLAIKDYSTFAEDDFGDESPVERPYKKTARFTTNVANAYVSELFNLLAGYRATPTLIIADPGYAASAVWGLATFSIDVPGPSQSFCSLDVRSRAR